MLQPEEYAQFKDAMVGIRHTLADERFGQAVHSGNEMRALYEMPATLHEIITNSLSVEELTWFKEGGANKKEGARWFAQNFPAFRIPDLV